MTEGTVIKEVKQIRRENLWRLRNEAENLHELSKMIGVSDVYISNLTTPSKKSGEFRRNMGCKIARRIENRMGLPEFWMDIDRDNSKKLLIEVPKSSLTLEDLTIIKKLAELKTEQKRNIINTINLIAGSEKKAVA